MLTGVGTAILWRKRGRRCPTSVVQDQLWLFYAMRFGSGVAVVLGAILFIYSVMVPRREVVTPGPLERDRLEHDADHMVAK